jgi:hypothetical protein
MKRGISGALLVAMAAAAAGCGGGTTVNTAALREAQESGGTEAHVMRVERWRLSDGDPWNVVLVKAKFCGTKNGFTAPKIHGRCLPVGVTFFIRPGASTGGGADFAGYGNEFKVARAWKARPAFRIFPDLLGVLGRCEIPRAGGGTVPGLCEAKLNDTRQVAFLEHWPLSQPPGSRNTAGWIVTLDRSARPISVERTGSTPPQAGA